MIRLKVRDYSIDVARGIACALVVIGHVPSTPVFVHTWIYSFHMPLFYIISGIVLNTSDSFKIFFKKRIKGLLIPYFALNLLVWTIETLIKIIQSLAVSHPIDYNQFLVGLAGTLIGYRLTDYYYILWFVISLFFALLISYWIIKFVKNKWKIGIIGILQIISNSLLWMKVRGLPLSLDVVPLATGYVLIGFSCMRLVKRIPGQFNWLGVPLIMINAVLAYLCSHQNGDVDFYNCQTGGVLLPILNSIIGCMGILMISKLIQRNRVLEFFSANSLVFYAFQNKIFIPIFNKGISYVNRVVFSNKFVAVEWIIVSIGTMIALSCVSCIINRIIPWIAGVDSYRFKLRK